MRIMLYVINYVGIIINRIHDVLCAVTNKSGATFLNKFYSINFSIQLLILMRDAIWHTEPLKRYFQQDSTVSLRTS